MKSYTQGHIKLAIQAVRANRWRSFLTMVGVIIGVASVISAVSIGEGVKQQVSKQINTLGKDVITVRPARIDHGGNGELGVFSAFNVSGSLSDRDYRTVADDHKVDFSVPLGLVAANVNGDPGHTSNGAVIGTSPDLPQVLNQQLAYGAFLTDDDAGAHVAVLGSHAASQLFDENVPLGRSFTINGQAFMVRGIFNDFDTGPLSPDADFNNAIFIPYDTAQEITNNHAVIYEILAKPSSPSQTNATARDINARLLKLHGGQRDFDVELPNQSLATTNRILDLLTHLITGIAAISLLVGGVGIMNVMLVSVTERMQEVGIRKAIGATDRQILMQFIIEATVISLLGGLVGIVLALFIDLLLRLYSNLQPVIHWQVVVLATFVSLLVGVLFGSAPALKAARKDPIDALRNE